MRRKAFYRFNPKIERSDLSDKCDTVLIKNGFLQNMPLLLGLKTICAARERHMVI